MKHLVVLAFALIAGCGNGDTGGGGGSVGSYEQAAEQTAQALREYGGVLDGVKDKGSAEAAKPKLEAIAKRLQGIATGLEKHWPPSEEPNTEQVMHAALESLSPKTTEYVMRVMDNPEIAQAIGGAFDAVQAQIMKLRGMLGG